LLLPILLHSSSNCKAYCADAFALVSTINVCAGLRVTVKKILTTLTIYRIGRRKDKEEDSSIKGAVASEYIH
jgi:hypothetical protein